MSGKDDNENNESNDTPIGKYLLIGFVVLLVLVGIYFGIAFAVKIWPFAESSCETNANCGDKQICGTDNKCVTVECKFNTDCTSPQVCNSSNVCVDPISPGTECIGSGQLTCGTGMVCMNGNCITPTVNGGIIPNGIYKIQQVLNDRFVDAYVGGDNNAVTRPAQIDMSQDWMVSLVTGTTDVYTFTNVMSSNSLQIDPNTPANSIYINSVADSNIIAGPMPINNMWKLVPVDMANNIYNVLSENKNNTSIYMDAFNSQFNGINEVDYSVVTRTQQNDTSQQWKFILV